MSLHQKPTMSKGHPTSKADSDRTPMNRPGDYLSVLCWRPMRTEPVETGRAASVRGHIWRGLIRVNRLFAILFQKRRNGSEALGSMWVCGGGLQPVPTAS